MAIVDELIAVLGYKVEGKDKLRDFQKGLDRAEKRAKASAQNVNRAAVRQERAIQTRAIATGTAIGTGLANGVEMAARKMVDAYKDFSQYELAMTRLAITAGIGKKQTEDLGNHLQAMAQRYGYATQDVMGGFGVLIAAGKSLEESLAFMPSILETSQASGAAINDVANTALKASDALKIPASRMQHAFDTIVTGAKLGSFEIDDMAQHLPDLVNSFAALGYRGEDGLRKVIALAQVVKDKTTTAGQAATSLGDVFNKIYAPATQNAFEKLGVNLEAELKKSTKRGEDLIEAFLRITRRAIKGDMAQLPKLFADKELQRGMRALLEMEAEYKRIRGEMTPEKVSGSVRADYNRVSDTSAIRIQKWNTASDNFWKKTMGMAAPTFTEFYDSVAGGIDFDQALSKALDKRGASWWDRLIAHTTQSDANLRMALEEGYMGPGAPGGKTAAENVALHDMGVNAKKQRELDAELDRLRKLQANPSRFQLMRPEHVSAKIADLEAEKARLRGSSYMAGYTATGGGKADFADRPMGHTASAWNKGGQPAMSADFAAKLDSINSYFTSVAQRAMESSATITDSRDQSVHTTVNLNVSQAVDAPRAAAGAVAGAVNQAAAPARLTAGPAN